MGAAPPGLVLALDDSDLDDAVMQAFGLPFARESGTQVRCDAGGFDAALVPDMVDDDRTVWDVCTTDFATGVTLARAGLFEGIDFHIIPREPAGALWWGVPAYAARLVLARDGAAGDAPANWTEFYDGPAFPGTRAMPASLVIGVLETALLADGVAADALYPLDADRAFSRLQALRPQMKFWRDGAQARAVMMGGASAGLLYSHTAQALRNGHGRVAWASDQGIRIRAFWAVPKGGPAGADAAMRFIASTQGRKADLLAGEPAAADAVHAMAANEAWYVENAGWLLARWHALVQG